MDPEDLADEVRVFQTLCTHVADKYHGHVSNYLGDGILVLFGHPHSNEFDAVHAVHAGLAMIKEVEQNNNSFNWRNKQPIYIRIGIATSLVVVGERAGEQRNQDELIFGEAPNLASRLQGIAEQNTVVTSLRTRRLVGSKFIFRELGEQKLKGFAHPVPAWQLLQQSAFQNRHITPLKRVTTQFVSRKQELLFLSDCFKRSVEGESVAVHIVGEPGIGKSRLLRVFEKTLKEQSIYRIRIGCSPFYESTPLRPVIDELNRWIQINFDDHIAIKKSKIQRALNELRLHDTDSMALLSELLAVNPIKETLQSELSAEVTHFRTMNLLTQIIVRLCDSRPVLLVVEDLHWSDPTTLELLNNLIINSRLKRILLILTSRAGFQSQWCQSDSVINLDLHGLDQQGSTGLVRSVFGSDTLPQSIEHSIIKKSDGIPLYLEECSWHILNQIRENNGIAPVTDDLVIPDTLQDSLNARLDSLGSAKQLAQLASAFGAFFTYSMIEKIADINGIDADNNMDILLQAGMLNTVFNKQEDRYTFKHTMFQDAAYMSLLKRTRQRYHKQIAELFISVYPEIQKDQPELIAYHYSRTEHLDTAVDYWIKAGKSAISKSAISEALEHLDRGIRLLKDLPHKDFPHGEINKGRELEMMLSFAVCLTLRSGYYGDQVTQIYKHCIALANDIGNAEQQWSALYGFWRCLICQAEFELSIQISVKLKSLCKVLDDRKLYMTSLGIQAMTRMVDGKFNSAEKYYSRSVKLYDLTEDKNIGIRFGQDPFVTIQGLGAINRLITNKIFQSKLEIETSVAVSRSIGHPYTIAETLRLAAMYEQISRNMISLRKFAREAIELSEQFGFEGLLAASNIFFAFSNVVVYRDFRSIETIRVNLDRYKEKYGLLLYPYFQGLLAESYLYLEQYKQAFAESNHVLTLIDNYSERWGSVPMMLIRIESAARGKLAERVVILNWYDEAEVLAKKQQAELFVQRIVLSRSEFEHKASKLFSSQLTCSRNLSRNSMIRSTDNQHLPSVSRYIINSSQ